MTKILILEDAKYRQVEFKKNFLGSAKKKNHVKIVDTAQKAISQLKKFKWDFLFLDHDLGDEGTEAKTGTGYDVALWLEQHNKKIPVTVIIHSMNPVGAKKMVGAIPKAILLPCAWTKKFD